MTDPLAGMTREEARELVASSEVQRDEWGLYVLTPASGTKDEVDNLLALAALGAESLGYAGGELTEHTKHLGRAFYSELTVKMDEVIEAAPHSRVRVLVLKEDK